MSKPTVFIGSSSEGIDISRAVRSLLQQDAEITIWNEGFFGLGNTFIETLVNSLSRFDFAILIFTPDDTTKSRETELFSPRDNVIFEAGLFMGKLGRERCYILHQSNAGIKMPSDLSGITTASYEWPRTDSNYLAAVGAACDRIREMIRALGISEQRTAKAIQDIKSRQDKQEQELFNQQNQIRSLQVALQGILTNFEYDKLEGLSRTGPFLCYYSDDLINELKRVRAMGLIENHDGRGLREITNRFKNSGQEFDVKEFFFLTEQGNEYLKLRHEIAN